MYVLRIDARTSLCFVQLLSSLWCASFWQIILKCSLSFIVLLSLEGLRYKSVMFCLLCLCELTISHMALIVNSINPPNLPPYLCRCNLHLIPRHRLGPMPITHPAATRPSFPFPILFSLSIPSFPFIP